MPDILNYNIKKCLDCGLGSPLKTKIIMNKVNVEEQGLRVLIVGDVPNLSDVTFRKFGEGVKADFIYDMISCASNEVNVQAVWLTALVHCIPQIGKNGPVRFPSSIEILKCSKWLHEEIKQVEPDLLVFEGKETWEIYKKEYPEAIVIPNIRMLMKQGGTGSPYYFSTVRLLNEELKNAQTKQNFEII